MLVTLLGMVTLLSRTQLENISESIHCSADGSFTLVSAEQPSNALHPMLVTLLGMVTLVSDVQL